jgi:hypothetical protein
MVYARRSNMRLLIVVLRLLLLLVPGWLLVSMNGRDIGGRVGEGCGIISSPSLFPVADEILQVLNSAHDVLARWAAMSSCSSNANKPWDGVFPSNNLLQ